MTNTDLIGMVRSIVGSDAEHLPVPAEAAWELLVEFAKHECLTTHYAEADDSCGWQLCPYCEYDDRTMRHTDSCLWLRARKLVGL